jgi:hypothetical protein
MAGNLRCDRHILRLLVPRCLSRGAAAVPTPTNAAPGCVRAMARGRWARSRAVHLASSADRTRSAASMPGGEWLEWLQKKFAGRPNTMVSELQACRIATRTRESRLAGVKKVGRRPTRVPWRGSLPPCPNCPDGSPRPPARPPLTSLGRRPRVGISSSANSTLATRTSSQGLSTRRRPQVRSSRPPNARI